MRESGNQGDMKLLGHHDRQQIQIQRSKNSSHWNLT